MLFLTRQEIEQWSRLEGEIETRMLAPSSGVADEIGRSLCPCFHFYAGTTLAAKGHGALGMEWLKAGTLPEEQGLFSNAFLTAYLERHQGNVVLPVVIFADPRPYVHFTTIPVMAEARRRFIAHCRHSLPDFPRPLRFMDIGCGNGTLTRDLLLDLQSSGRARDIEEVLLIDSSAGMIELATRTVAEAFPRVKIRTVTKRFEEVSEAIDAHYDVAVSSLAYHHMPREKKVPHLVTLKPWIDHFILYEITANNDTPELHSPELACSIYQSYGRLIDFVFAHDAPIHVAQACVDQFLMAEEVSFLTQPRGRRTDYHMLRSQWHGVFKEALGSDFTCWSDSTAYADDYIECFTLHYGR